MSLHPEPEEQPSYDQQSTLEYLSTLTFQTLIARVDLLTAILEDIDTFSSITALKRDLERWYQTHLAVIALYRHRLRATRLRTRVTELRPEEE